MERRVSNEELMQFLDHELDPEQRGRIETELASSTELRRDLARYRQLQAEVRSLSAGIRPPGIWDSIHRRLARPLGWILLVAGTALWTGWSGWLYFTSDEDLAFKAAMGAVTIGFVMLLASTLHQRWREWQTDPYRDIER